MPKPGQIIQRRYRIESVIGQGGMGVVYLATDQRLKRSVALKALRIQSSDPIEQVKFREQFELEAQILAACNHPNLARVTDFFEDNAEPYLVMDLIRGRTLEQVASSSGLPEATALSLISQILDALEYLHTRTPPVIVRDLKPSNIMVEEGTVFLIDFGIAKLLTGQGTKSIVRDVGSEGFAPLEQYGGGGTDQRSDLYALGATLLFLLGGRVPPEATTRVTDNIPLPDPRRVNTTVSDSTWAAIQALMAIAPSNRPSSASEARGLLGLVAKQNKKKASGSAMSGAGGRTVNMPTGRSTPATSAVVAPPQMTRTPQVTAHSSAPGSITVKCYVCSLTNRVDAARAARASQITCGNCNAVLQPWGATHGASVPPPSSAGQATRPKAISALPTTQPTPRSAPMSPPSEGGWTKVTVYALSVGFALFCFSMILWGPPPPAPSVRPPATVAYGSPATKPSPQMSPGTVIARFGSNVTFARWSPNGRYVETWNPPKFCDSPTIWDVSGTQPQALIQFSGEFLLDWSPDGQRILAMPDKGGIRLVDIASKGTVFSISPEQLALSKRRAPYLPRVLGQGFSPDGKRVLAGDEVSLWDAQTGTLLARPQVHGNHIRADFSRDGRLLVTNEEDISPETKYARSTVVTVRDGVTGKPLSEHRFSAWAGAELSPDGRLLAVTADELRGRIVIWDSRNSGRRVSTLRDPGWRSHDVSLRFTPNSQRVLTRTSTESSFYFCLWDTSTGIELWRTGAVSDFNFAFTPDGSLFWTHDPLHNWARVWSSSSGKPTTGKLQNFGMLPEISGDGELLAIKLTHLQVNGRVAIYRTRSGSPICESIPARTEGALFSPDSKRLLTVDPQGTACIRFLRE